MKIRLPWTPCLNQHGEFFLSCNLSNPRRPSLFKLELSHLEHYPQKKRGNMRNWGTYGQQLWKTKQQKGFEGGRNAAFMQNIWHFEQGRATCFEFHSQMVCVKPSKKKKKIQTTKCRDGQNEFPLLVERAVCCVSPSAQLNWSVQHRYGSGFRLGALMRNSGRKLC